MKEVGCRRSMSVFLLPYLLVILSAISLVIREANDWLSLRSFAVFVYQFVSSRGCDCSLVVCDLSPHLFFYNVICCGSVVRVQETTSTGGLWDTGV